MPLPTLLDKPYGYRRSKAQLARNRAAAALLESGSLRPGDLYVAVAGVEPLPVDEVNPVTISGRRTLCIDCRRELEWAGKQLKSQPRRCLPCGQLKRRTYNQQARRDPQGEQLKPEAVQEPEPEAVQESESEPEKGEPIELAG